MKRESIRTAISVTIALVLVAGCAMIRQTESDREGRPVQEKNRTKITIMANLHTAEIPSDTIEKMVEEKTGTELEIRWTPDGSYDERVNASLATGTLPKALYLKNAASVSLFRNEMRDGMFWEIGPFLDRYPNLSGLKPEVLRDISVDGRLYALYQERPLSRQGVIYRKDWADNLGLKPPSNIEELYGMLKQFTDRDPDRNGIADTVGLTDRGDLIYGAFKTVSSYFGTPNGWGERNGKLAPEFMFPQYMETMKFFRKLHEEGLMNQDFPVTSKTDQQALLINGKAGVYIGAMGDVIPLESKLKEVNPQANLDVVNRIKGPQGYGIWAGQGYGTIVLFPKSAIGTEEELLDILAFFDQLMSPDIVNLLYWGVEGVHYTLREGRAVPSDDIKLTDKEVKPYQALVIGGHGTIPGMLQPDYNLPAKNKAEQLTLDNESMLILDPTASLESRTYNEKGARLQEIVNDATYQFILGMLDEEGFRTETERWLREGGQQIIEEYNAAYEQSR